MCPSDTLAMLVSITSMNVAMETTTAISHGLIRLGAGGKVPEARDWKELLKTWVWAGITCQIRTKNIQLPTSNIEQERVLRSLQFNVRKLDVERSTFSLSA